MSVALSVRALSWSDSRLDGLHPKTTDVQLQGVERVGKIGPEGEGTEVNMRRGHLQDIRITVVEDTVLGEGLNTTIQDNDSSTGWT